MANALSDKELELIDAYWRAANYLSVGQIYLYDNPLLKQTLTKEHIKPRLLGHWGTTPGLNFIYVHLNRLINGPGHGWRFAMRSITSLSQVCGSSPSSLALSSTV